MSRCRYVTNVCATNEPELFEKFEGQYASYHKQSPGNPQKLCPSLSSVDYHTSKRRNKQSPGHWASYRLVVQWLEYTI